MRKFLIICSLVSLTACSEDAGYEISGTVNPAGENKEIYVSALDQTTSAPKVIDTVEVVDGKFQLNLPEVEEPTISFLNVPGARGTVLFIAENTPISFEIYPDSLYTTKIEGGEENKILTDFTASMFDSQLKLGDLRAEMMQAFSAQDTAAINAAQAEQEVIVEKLNQQKRELVESHPNSLVSLMVMQEMIGTKMYPTAELKELYEGLSSEVRSTAYGKVVGEAIANLSSVSIGSKAPDFSAPTPEGETLALNEVLGEVTLVDFWASWCKPCRVENPNIVKAYEKYHDKGFNILGVSLDRQEQKDRWIQAIADDNLTWPQISNLQFWQDPIAQKYGIQAIPASFLLDENGVIIATNLRGDALHQKLAELLGEE